jgi:hypothetical protein
MFAVKRRMAAMSVRVTTFGQEERDGLLFHQNGSTVIR